MIRILITGATGNVGKSVIKYLANDKSDISVVAAVRNIERARKELGNIGTLGFVYFDFEDFTCFDAALEQINIIFLLRPPHIADIQTYIKPFIQAIKAKGINQVVFLSVQGADRSKVIPHHKIEKLIENQELNFIFMRPSYFMQNLTTTLSPDILRKRKIILPAGSAKFNWIDIENIGELAAKFLLQFDFFKNRAYVINGSENLNFYEVTRIMNSILDEPVTYQDINLFKFYNLKRKEGVKKEMIWVMMMIHFIPRFQKLVKPSTLYKDLTGKEPTKLIDFIKSEKNNF